MRLPASLRRLDDRVLPRGGRKRAAEPDDGEHVEREERVERVRTETSGRPRGGGFPSSRDGLSKVLAVVYRVSKLVFLLLALTVGLGILFTLAPTNPDNVVVDGVLRVADAAAGPFRDVFTVSDDRDREIVVNYAFAAGVYLIAAALVGRLPTGGKRA